MAQPADMLLLMYAYLCKLWVCLLCLTAFLLLHLVSSKLLKLVNPARVLRSIPKPDCIQQARAFLPQLIRGNSINLSIHKRLAEGYCRRLRSRYCPACSHMMRDSLLVMHAGFHVQVSNSKGHSYTTVVGFFCAERDEAVRTLRDIMSFRSSVCLL